MSKQIFAPSSVILIKKTMNGLKSVPTSLVYFQYQLDLNKDEVVSLKEEHRRVMELL